MKYVYQFPVVKGLQACQEYYIAMVPVGTIERLFPEDPEYVEPQYRAQRRINDSRIPDICKYILLNRENYVFSALATSIDGDFSFVGHDDSDVGILEVSMDARFLINDGQHRKAALLEAMKKDVSL